MDTTDTSSVQDLIAARTAMQPEAIAVEQSDRRLTYAELDERANQLAHHCRAVGIGRGSVVAIRIERSPELIVSLLATLKAGATYLPVDPSTPDHRLETYVKETDCAALITASEDHHRFAHLPAPILGPDAGADRPATAPGVAVEPTDAAYVVYTSGSTGSPKGVRVDHASLGYLCGQINERYGIGPTDRVLQFAATSFDTSIEQILVTLLHGATLVLPDFGWAPSELPERLVSLGVTVMDLTPPYWRAFLTALAQTPMELPVRLTIVGGSAVYAEDCRTALRLMPGSRLVNAYGLTETTITSCTMEITADVLPARGPAPVGRPLPRTVVHVLDADRQPVQPGRHGEIYIGGPGVAHGYLSEQPGRFVPDPLTGATGQRAYRTGDLGGWTAAGNLEIVGRVDRQLKIRGFRVEPAEIETTLATHELVDDVAVTAYQHGGERRIAAFYTCARAVDPPARSDLRAHVARHLPAHMIPTTLVRLPSMPVTAHGKIDLDALPDPLQATPAGAAAAERLPARPASRVEQAVAALWCEVLDLDTVDPDDNFFDRGGNSILAAELLAKVRATLGILITQVRPLIRVLLDDASLRGFAVAVESARAGTLGAGNGSPADFATDAVLDVPIRRRPAARWEHPEHILLTGSSGFLGIYLLRELLTTTDATVHCLVRAQDAEHAWDRVRRNAEHYFDDDLTAFQASGRIVAVPGDIAEPRLGLSDAAFDRLARIVDVIHHPGGLVNFIYPYSHMRPANVEGTREIIRLAARYRNAPIHYVSTMAVISGFGTAGVDHVAEQTPLAHVDHLSVGYVESKWVAEELLRNAAREGLPVAIYRAADISGDRARGAWNTATEMCAMTRFIVDTGLSPIAELPLDYTPVDCYAAAVAHIAARRCPTGETYHLTNPGKVNVSVLAERLRAHGHAIREVPWEQWIDQLVGTAIEQPNHPMTPFAPLFIDRCTTGDMSVAEMYLESTFPGFTRDNVDEALRGSGIEIPPVDDALLDLYIRYLTSIDFLRRPC